MSMSTLQSICGTGWAMLSFKSFDKRLEFEKIHEQHLKVKS